MAIEEWDDKQLVEALCAIEDGLSEWETGFVESIAKWVLDDERKLTVDQREKAEQIWETKGDLTDDVENDDDVDGDD